MSSAVLKPGYEWAEVLITVKTYPTPSLRHYETVCVAGVRLDRGSPEWIRLYPIPFRVQTFEYPFSKYQLVRVPVTPRGTKDPRPESFTPDIAAFELGEVVKSSSNWRQRKRLVGDLVGATTTCDLIKANRASQMNAPAPSLGLVKPRDVRVTVQEGQPWKPNQLAKARRAAEPTLFDEAAVRNELEPMPYEMRISYKCMSDSCNGHNQTNLDWEVGAAAYHWRKQYPKEEISRRLKEKWEASLAEDKDAHLFVGNQHQYRRSFLVLGIWYPKLG